MIDDLASKLSLKQCDAIATSYTGRKNLCSSRCAFA